MSETPPELLQMFRDEGEERLGKIVAALLALEKGQTGPELVDELFRETHTLKGTASMLGLEEIRVLASGMEDLLAGARDGGQLPPDRIEPLLRAADSLRGHLAGNGAPAEVVVEQRSIRVPSEKIDALLGLVGETVLHNRRLEHAVETRLSQSDDEVSDELAQGLRLAEELKDTAIGMRTIPLRTIIGPFPRAVRDLAAAQGKEVELVLSGGDTELDRVILEGLSDPLVHVLRNSVAHGIEAPAERERLGKPRSGRLELRAEQRGRLVEITVSDDGRGVAEEALKQAREGGSLTDVLTQPGFSTAEDVSDLSGRGVGLDAVKAQVEGFGGSLEVRSEPGRGTDICLLLPLALALLEVLLVERGGSVFGLPLGNVEEVLAVTDTLSLGGRPALELHGESVPLADLATLVGADASDNRERAPAVVLSVGGRRIAVRCDALLGQQEVVVKALGPLLATLTHYLGAAILGDGRVALLLDPAALVRAWHGGRPAAQSAVAPSVKSSPKVLVVEDSFAIRELQRSILEAAGYPVDTARDGREALDLVSADQEIGLVVSDVEMPDMGGIELTESIRAMPERSRLPVVIVTSREGEEDRKRGIEAGADAYMVKRSFDQQELLETVQRLIGR